MKSISGDPKVSIITPSLNQAPFLEQAIQSVLNQDYPNIEYIIIDGGSNDGSADIIQKYAQHLSYWVSEPDGGQSAAINKGLHHSTGEIWAWMNADDAYLPGAVNKAVDWIRHHPELDIVYGDCLIVNENGQRGEYFHAKEAKIESMLNGSIGIPSGSTFLRRSVRDQIGDLNESFHYILDNDYWLRAVLVCSFGHIPDALSLYRIYPDAKTWDGSQSERRAGEIIHMYEEFWAQTDLLQTIQPLRARSMVNAYLYSANLACQVDRRDLCWYYIKKSLGVGIEALCPRFARLVLYLLLGKKVNDALQKLR